MTYEQIKKFASDACALISNYQEVTAKLMKQAGALSDDATAKLEKAANAVYEMYDRPAKIKVDDIVSFWKSNPAAMADTITKIASERRTTTSISGDNLGTAMPKKASAEDAKSADEIFWSKYR